MRLKPRPLMRCLNTVLPVLVCLVSLSKAQATEINSLPLLPREHFEQARTDWLLAKGPFKAGIYRSSNNKEIILSNELLRHHFRIYPNAATVALDCTSTGQSLLRSVRPEAIVQLDGKHYPVGGLIGQPVHNYLRQEWVEALTNQPGSFEFSGFETGSTRERFPWKKRLEWIPADLPWPPPGVGLTLNFNSPTNAPPATVQVHYELYDGI